MLNVKKQSHTKCLSIHQESFTTIEILSVLIILSIITAVIVSRVGVGGAQVTSEAGIIKAHLRFSQYLAISNDIYSWRITFSSGSPDFYTLSRVNKSDGTETTPINLPNEGSPTRALPSPVSITAGLGAVTFDEWGSPGTGNQSITLSDGAGNSETITIVKNTGFIP
jgi:hypothetical protein